MLFSLVGFKGTYHYWTYVFYFSRGLQQMEGLRGLWRRLRLVGGRGSYGPRASYELRVRERPGHLVAAKLEGDILTVMLLAGGGPMRQDEDILLHEIGEVGRGKEP